MIKYPADYNPILEYWNDIVNSKEVVPVKIHKTYKKIVYDLTDNNSEFFYSPARANHVIEFIENFCRHSKGKLGGQPVILELWEKAMLATIFGFIDINGIRKYNQAILIVGKKNGKSLLASCVGLYMQVGDLENGPEVYAVASKRDQAKIIWLEAKSMVRKSPSLRKRIKTLVAELRSDFNDGVFKPLASESDTLDGLNVSCVLMDEIHSWKNGKALFDIMYDGTTAREQPLTFITSTAGTVREDIFDEKYDESEKVINGYFDESGYHDEHFIAFIYELDNRKEWKNEKCWKKANPGLGTIKNLAQLKSKVERAKSNPSLVKNLLCKEFNIRETSSEAWLTFEQLNNTEKFDVNLLKPRYGIGGCDLSKTTDLTAAKVIFMVPNDKKIYVLQMYWLPEDLIEQRTKEDKTPYTTWRDRGLLRTCEGNTINYKDVTAWFREIQEEYDIYLVYVGYDAWSAKYWVDDMSDYFGKEAMIPVIQGKKTLSLPMQQLGKDLEAKRVVYNDNPIDKVCLFNTAIETDKNQNIQPCKTKNQRKRVDGLAALLDAYVILQLKYEEYLSRI